MVCFWLPAQRLYAFRCLLVGVTVEGEEAVNQARMQRDEGRETH